MMTDSQLNNLSSETVLDVGNLVIDIDVPAGTLHAVSDISFDLKQGETLCIVGESGCGKSITSLAVMNLLPRKARMRASQLSLQGIDLLALNEKEFAALRGNKMGMIFQDAMTSLNPVYRVGDQMEEVFLRHRSGGRKEAREKAIYFLEKVGITGAKSRLTQYPHQLSGGLRQRIMIAMTLMCEPALIIADEPTTALDVTIQAQILHLLSSLQKELNMAMILITHDLGVVARMADRVAIMYAGKIVETGTCNQIFAKPLHPYTQGLLRCIPVPGKSKPDSKLGSIKGLVPALIGDLEGCLFRNRCQYLEDDCITENVDFVALSEGRTYRCLMASDRCQENFSAVEIRDATP